MAVLEVCGVSKIYSAKGKKPIVAVKDANFSVNAGEIVGFIGPNGAGKSTTIKIITGLATASAGNVYINGFDVAKDRIKAMKNVGCIVENPDLYRDWTAMQNLNYLFSLEPYDAENNIENLPKKEFFKAREEDLLKLVGLYERRNDKVSKYSLGMKQRLGIAQALLNRPKLLILDEPTNGLDPAGIKEIRDILHRLATEYQMAIMVSSHLLSEMQLTCDRFIIINKGEIIGSYSKEDIEKLDNMGKAVLSTDDVVKAKDELKAMGIEAEIIGNGKLEFSTDKAINDIAKELILSGVTVLGINKESKSLEDLFMDVTDNKKPIEATKAEGEGEQNE